MTYAFSSLNSGEGSEGMEVFIYQVSLDSTSKYEALSYTWAASDNEVVRDLPHMIHCGDCDIEVITNLRATLLHLRQPYRRRVFWIDAVCID